MFGLSNFIITEFLLIFYLLVTNVLYSYRVHDRWVKIYQLMHTNRHRLETIIRKCTKKATSIDMLFDVALKGTFIMYLCMKFLYLQLSTHCEVWTFTSNALIIRI